MKLLIQVLLSDLFRGVLRFLSDLFGACWWPSFGESIQVTWKKLDTITKQVDHPRPDNDYKSQNLLAWFLNLENSYPPGDEQFAPARSRHPKMERIVFQPSIFRCDGWKFQGGYPGIDQCTYQPASCQLINIQLSTSILNCSNCEHLDVTVEIKWRKKCWDLRLDSMQNILPNGGGKNGDESHDTNWYNPSKITLNKWRKRYKLTSSWINWVTFPCAALPLMKQTKRTDVGCACQLQNNIKWWWIIKRKPRN